LLPWAQDESRRQRWTQHGLGSKLRKHRTGHGRGQEVANRAENPDNPSNFTFAVARGNDKAVLELQKCIRRA
jgi:hypothetical protein